ncbi:toxin-antitoxin system, toxin component, MazF family protein [Lentilactobacillus hilgardii]|nr:toxin-antitoxin system, toxin component, MazF family protein [Lentilactobacillus hilgardii]MCV3740757.1 toxin-antitoxin system, toxin component, MazF family protein [Lentilactobacillus hilgardii]
MRKIKNASVVFAYVRFQEKTGGKLRPVLIFKMPGRTEVAFKITSKYKNKSQKIKRMYYEIKYWQEAGLRKPSWVDTGFKLDVGQLNIEKVFGVLDIEDVKGLRAFILNL